MVKLYRVIKMGGDNRISYSHNISKVHAKKCRLVASNFNSSGQTTLAMFLLLPVLNGKTLDPENDLSKVMPKQNTNT